MVYKTLHRKQKIEQHKPYEKPGLNPSVPKGQRVPTPLVAPYLTFWY
jgi:hypothetical protein